jgi:hypothetical protein
MLRLKIQDSLYQVKFYYIDEAGVLTRGEFKTDTLDGVECTILKNGKVMSRGKSFCHPNDIFNKSVGRKKALAKAVLFLPKEMRQLIWDEYFKLSPKSKR